MLGKAPSVRSFGYASPELCIHTQSERRQATHGRGDRPASSAPPLSKSLGRLSPIDQRQPPGTERLDKLDDWRSHRDRRKVTENILRRPSLTPTANCGFSGATQ